MEEKNSLSIINTTTGKITAEIIKSPAPGSSTRQRRSRPVQLFKVALLMIRRRSFKTKPADVVAAGASVTGTNNMLNILVGSVRPLHHLQSTDNAVSDSSCNDNHSNSAARISFSYSENNNDDNNDGMSSQYGSAENLREMSESQSRYASAVNLHDMDDDGGDDNEGGDEMIDAKAEEFIAQFYAQIRLQRLNSMDRQYNEMIERSIA